MNLMSANHDAYDETTRSIDNNSDDLMLSSRGEAAPSVKEHMFDKVVTPSDVGKLNRLVIPKQHAEKYFPLDSSTNEKGLVLNFEDRNGKPWRFRYSYWNSSQSYVMTKGWSRFVKEKNLDAGDTVSFHRAGKDRFFIDWRRRSDTIPVLPHMSFQRHGMIQYPWSGTPNMFLHPTTPYPHFLQGNSHHYHPYGNNIVVLGNPCPPSVVPYPRLVPGGGGGLFDTSSTQRGHVLDVVPRVVQGKAVAGKRLRLFGVNMDCPVNSEEDDHQCHDRLPNLNLDSSSSSISSLPLRSYNNRDDNYHGKGKGSMSLDLDI